MMLYDVPDSLGQSIPPNTDHALSVSLPTWRSNVGYEKQEDWVLRRMTTGYPRFFLHQSIKAFSTAVVQRYGSPGEHSYLFPTPKSAARCCQFLSPQRDLPNQAQITIIDLYPNDADQPIVSAVILPKKLVQAAKLFWQHTGEGISSRRAQYCLSAFQDGRLRAKHEYENFTLGLTFSDTLPKGPKRYQKTGPNSSSVSTHQNPTSDGSIHQAKDYHLFVEERFGRNLDKSLANDAKLAIRKRIANTIVAESSDLASPSTTGPSQLETPEHVAADDVYLYPCGMNAIFQAHQLLLTSRGHLKSVNFGFPYVDTLKILEKFGPGCFFCGFGSQEELDDIEERCKGGEKLLALFCEFPGNPLLQTPDLSRIRSLADRYDFAVVIDETIGNFVNVNVLPLADIVVSSLTKVFTGECNVMGGSLVLNPQRKYYDILKSVIQSTHEDTYWPEDAIFMERNSRDYRSRIFRINANAERICDILLASSIVKTVYYPKHNASRRFFDQHRHQDGGYGGLLSVTFKTESQAIAFHDSVKTEKGPSLGTNFTLCSPYVVLAHYNELDWARSFGVDPDLIRVSVGLEEPAYLEALIKSALEVATCQT